MSNRQNDFINRDLPLDVLPLAVDLLDEDVGVVLAVGDVELVEGVPLQQSGQVSGVYHHHYLVLQISDELGGRTAHEAKRRPLSHVRRVNAAWRRRIESATSNILDASVRIPVLSQSFL